MTTDSYFRWQSLLMFMSVEIEKNTGHEELIAEYHSGDIEGVSVLPRFGDTLSEDDILYETDTATIRKLLEQSGLEYTPLDIESESPTVVERSDALVLPAIYFSYRLARNNWDKIEEGIKAVGDYYIQRATREIDVEVVQEKENGETTKFKYTGHPDDLEMVPEEMKSVIDGDSEDHE